MTVQLQNKLIRVKETYSLIRKLTSINGYEVSSSLLDRVMYNKEMLPPLGKEYWWFLFFGKHGTRPVQFMLLIFRKYGKNMSFNNNKMALQELTDPEFQAVTTGWIYDGKEIRDLGDTNSITMVCPEKKIIDSKISDNKLTLSGGFPTYKLELGDLIKLNINNENCLGYKDAYGVFLPPFGVGWVDAYLAAEGFVLGKKFEGTAHLQKVVGIMPFGPFHWLRVAFHNGASISLFCLKTGKDSQIYFHRSILFYDVHTKKVIKFNNPNIKISKKGEKTPVLIVEGKDNNKEVKIILNIYATKKFTMKGGGSQVYIEYAVKPISFTLKTEDQEISLDNLGGGVGTFEDAYGKPF